MCKKRDLTRRELLLPVKNKSLLFEKGFRIRKPFAWRKHFSLRKFVLEKFRVFARDKTGQFILIRCDGKHKIRREFVALPLPEYPFPSTGIIRRDRDVINVASDKGRALTDHRFMFRKEARLPERSNLPVQGTAADDIKKTLEVSLNAN